MTSILVTGALGVIGSHLTKVLRSRGYEVIGADLQIRDYSDDIRADVTSFDEDLHRIGKRHEIDVVIHMAGEVGRMVGEMHPQRMVHVNDVGATNVIQLSSRRKRSSCTSVRPRSTGTCSMQACRSRRARSPTRRPHSSRRTSTR